MAERRPLVVKDGRIEEFPVGDTLPAALGGGGGGLFSNLTATTAPAVTNDNTESYVVGSRWIDVTNDNTYTCVDITTGAAVWVQENLGTTGADGAAGEDGNTILYGVIAPTTEGVDDDFYIDTVTNTIYGPKAAGSWPAGTSLIGPDGPAGADGTTGSYVSPIATYAKNTSTALSTSLYAAKGGIFTALVDQKITKVATYVGAVAQTVKLVIAVVSEVNPGTVTEILYDGAPEVLPGTAGIHEHEIVGNVVVTTDQIIAFIFVRTDAGDTGAMNLAFPSTTYGDNAEWAEGAAIRSAQDTVIVTDTLWFSDTSSARVDITSVYSDYLLALAVPAGGTTGQKLTKIDGADYNTQWEDDTSPLITLGTTITASRDLTNADLAGGVFLDVGHASTPIVLNIPLGLTGTEPVTFQQIDVAAVSFTVAGGGSIKSLDSYLTIAGDGGSATLVPKGSNVYGLIGALTT